ncbi:hypothetical protein AAE478_010643 [Parahypoxylon ruwenzoriense]
MLICTVIIVPIDDIDTDITYQLSAFGETSSTISSVFGFDITTSEDAKKVKFSPLDGYFKEKTAQNKLLDVV